MNYIKCLLGLGFTKHSNLIISKTDYYKGSPRRKFIHDDVIDKRRKTFIYIKNNHRMIAVINNQISIDLFYEDVDLCKIDFLSTNEHTMERIDIKSYFDIINLSPLIFRREFLINKILFN